MIINISEIIETASPMYVITSRAVATPSGGTAGLRSCGDEHIVVYYSR